MARKTYKFHNISIPQANDPTKTISKDNYTSPTHHSEDGMIGFDAPDATLVSNVLTPVDSVVVVRGEGAAADVIDHITYGSAPDIKDKDLLWLAKGAEAITINHNTASPPANSAPVLLLSEANKKMIGSRMVLLQRQGSNFQEIAFDGTVGNNGVLVTDDSGKAIIICGSEASAVNHLKVINAATGNDVKIEAAGTDTNIGITITPKGNGRLTLLEQVVSNIRESTGKAIAIAITAIASAVNYIEVKANTTTNNPEIQAKGSDTNVGIKLVPKGTGEIHGNLETVLMPLGDESTVLTTGTKYTFYMIRSGKFVGAGYAQATVAPTTSALILDILKNGTTIFSTKPEVAATANKGSKGVLSTNPTTFAAGDKIELVVDTLDSGGTGAGAKVGVGIYYD